MSTPTALPPLASPDDVADRLARELTDAEYDRLPILLADASAMIRNYCRQPFTSSRATQRLRPIGYVVRLPRRPVAAVHTVTMVFGDLLLPTPGFFFDGLDEVSLVGVGVVLNLPEIALDYLAEQDLVAEVDYTAGYIEIPPDVVAVACGMAGRALTMPGTGGMGGVVSETVAEYNYKLSESFASAGPLALTDADKATLSAYRPASTLVELRT